LAVSISFPSCWSPRLNFRSSRSFAKNLLAVIMKMRFYAGMPVQVLATPGNPRAKKITIGTICIMDEKPRQSFDTRERAQLCVPPYHALEDGKD
jgi:hypothetical protein